MFGFLVELVIEAILELFVEESIATGKKGRKSRRFFAALVIFLFAGLILALTWAGIGLLKEEPVGGVFILLLAGLLLTVAGGGLRKKYKERKPACPEDLS